MPKPISLDETNSVLEAVASFPDGAGIEKIHEALGGRVVRRTLQRRLALLVEQQFVLVEGQARARRYRLPVANGLRPNTAYRRADGGGEISIPMSADGEALRQAVRRPIQNRRPIGYNRGFLDSYQPNDTFYLTRKNRLELHEIGSAPAIWRTAGTYARNILHRLLIDLSWNSSRLEGNTYSLLETERLLEGGEAAEGKNAVETQMLLNHKSAIELLVDQAEVIGFNTYTLLNLHALLADNLLPDPQACGRLRTMPVGIGGSTYHPLEVPQLIDECFRRILAKASEIADPFEQAFFVMVHLPYLQPFQDVNKRVSRLAANISLIRGNLCPLSFVDVPDHIYIEGIVAVYELNRIELLRDVFVWAYRRSSDRYSAIRQSLGEPDPFRLKFRVKIKEVVAEVVRRCMDKRLAAQWIAGKAATDIPLHDQHRFIEVVETELSSLHEGNFARYLIRPAEFEQWRQGWR